MTPSKGPTYRTANLTLASFLAHNGKQYQLRRGEGRSATWEFARSQVVGLVVEFEQGEAHVEPQAFHHSITNTRRMLFDFINSGEEVWNPAKINNHIPNPPRAAAVASS